MAIEIELKAWVTDPAALEQRLRTEAQSEGSYRKEDQYWRKEGLSLGSGVRIRREQAESPAAVINFKQKEVRAGIEVNDEHEFEVSDGAEAALLLSRLGLSPYIRKLKTGTAWRLDGILVELSEIEGLGFFVELEILEERDDLETVERSRERLLACLDGLGIGRDAIETRYYTQMLAGKASGKS